MLRAAGPDPTMVTIITEKLKSQSLDDPTGQTVPVPVPRVILSLYNMIPFLLGEAKTPLLSHLQTSGNTWTFSSQQHAYKFTGVIFYSHNKQLTSA